jgi:hypothetical protein
MTQTSVIAAGDPATTEQLSTVNTSAAAAQAAANVALAEATTAIASANTAIATANAANAAATAAAFDAGVAQTTANGKAKVTYSTSVASGSGSNGDIWFRVNGSGSVITQYVYNGGWQVTPITDTVIANLDAGKITAGTITGIAYNNGSGTFSVSPSGVLVASSATITGAITATSGTFTGAVFASSGTFTGTVTATSGTFTGTVNATSGYIGNATTGWQFRSAGTIANNDNSTIFYPSGNFYALITNQPIATKGIQCDGDIQTTGTAIISSNGTSSNRNFFSYYNTISLQSISGGYGIDSDWSPQSDNTYNLGQATSAGYGANRRWQRLYSNNTTISTSDVNAKTDVTNSPLGLDFINSLRPISYRWIVGHHEVVKDAEGNPVIIGEDPMGKPIYELEDVPGVRLHYGFIAQEVKQAVDASGVEDFAGWVLDDVNEPNSTQSLSYEQFIAPMTKAIQELSARVQQLEGA